MDCLFSALCVIAVICGITPVFIFFLFPLSESLSLVLLTLYPSPPGWVYRYVQKFYLRTARELERLESQSKSPIYALLQGVILHIPSLRTSFLHTRRGLSFSLSVSLSRSLSLRLTCNDLHRVTQRSLNYPGI